MQRRAQNMLMSALIQFLFAGVLIAGLFMFGQAQLEGGLFKQQVFVTDNALLAESLQATSSGSLQLNSFYDSAEYQTTLKDDRIEIGTAEHPTGAQKRFATHKDTRVATANLDQQGIRWTRTENRLSAARLSVVRRCPSAQADAPTTAAAIAEPRLQGYVNRALGNNLFGTAEIRTRISEREDEEFFASLRTDARDTLEIYTGQGRANERLRCWANIHFKEFDPALRTTGEQAIGIHLIAPESYDEQQLQRVSNALQNTIRSYLRED